MRSFRVDTRRLAMHVYESGPEDGIPVVLLHGNLSTGRFYEHLFDDAPARFRLIAPDMRGFGDTERVPIDATRGLRDWADDTARCSTRSGIAAPPHLVGWSTGGAAIAHYAMERPVASLTFIDPVGPYGFGGVKLDGTPHFADFAGSGGGTGNPEFTARLAAGDASDDGDTAPRNVHEQLLLAGRAPASRPSARTCCWPRSSSRSTGDDGYPGDTATSEHWPGVAPGTRGILNALSPKYCNWAGIVDLDPKPPILWTHGAQDIVVADGSPWEMGTLGSLGAVPGWPGADVFPPQPMVTQIRDVLDRVRGARRAVRDDDLRGVRPLPAAGRARALDAAVLRLPGVVCAASPGCASTEHELDVPLDHAVGRREITSSRARSPTRTGATSRCWCTCRAARASSRRGPTGNPRGPGWLDRALKDFRVLLLDQRGTGRSTPVTGRECAEYLTHFRADTIVRDCRAASARRSARSRWSVLGQSYGGICSSTYLSFAPDGLREAFITGGAPGDRRAGRRRLQRHLGADGERNRRYYERYPAGPRADAGHRRRWTPRTSGCPAATA